MSRKNPAPISTGAGSAAGLKKEDRISGLPDEIIHEILARLLSPKQAAKLTLLSKRWIHLWRSYPVIEFDELEGRLIEPLEKFAIAARKKFNRQQPGLGQPSIIRINLGPYGRRFVRSEQNCSNLITDMLSYSGTGSYLRILCLNGVTFRDEGRLLNTIIANASLLETLTLTSIHGIRKLQVRNHPNLKSLEARFIFGLDDVEIVATTTGSLEIIRLVLDQSSRCNFLDPSLDNLILIAPRLKTLYIGGANLTIADVEAAIFKLPSLERLTLRHCNRRYDDELTKLRFSIPKLEEFTLCANGLDEIVIDARHGLGKFVLCFPAEFAYPPMTLEKCEILENSCLWELDLNFGYWRYGINDWPRELESFISRFARFRTVNISFYKDNGQVLDPMRFEFAEHLKFESGSSPGSDQMLDFARLFRVCLPKSKTVVRIRNRDYRKKGFFEALSNMAPSCFRGWKDAERKRVEESRESADCVIASEHLVSLLETLKQVCFKLNWYYC